MYMNQGNIVQIEAPDFDPDIDGDSILHADEKPNEVTIQGTLPTIPEVTESDEENRYTPAQTQHNQFVKKLIGLTLSLYKFQESLH